MTRFLEFKKTGIMRSGVRIIFGLTLVLAMGGWNPVMASPPDYLFVLDVSGEAKEFRDKQIEELQTQIVTGIYSRMRDGDRFTIWSASDKLNRSGFPVSTWTRDSASDLATRVTEFTLQLDWNQPSQWGKSLKTIYSVIKGTPSIHVVAITAPSNAFFGTQFDHRIEKFIQNKSREMTVFRVPMVTAIAGLGGKIADMSMSLAGESVPLFSKANDLMSQVGGQTNPAQTQNTSHIPKSKNVSSKPFIMKGDKVISNARADLPDTQHIEVEINSEAPSKDVETKDASIKESEVIPGSTNAVNEVQVPGVATVAVATNTTPEKSITQSWALEDVQAREIQTLTTATRDTSPGNKRPSDIDSKSESPAIATISDDGFDGAWMAFGIACIVTACGFLVLAFRFRPIGSRTSLISEAYSISGGTPRGDSKSD